MKKKDNIFFVDGSARIMWNLCQSYHLALVLVLYPCLEPILRVFSGVGLWMDRRLPTLGPSGGYFFQPEVARDSEFTNGRPVP